MAEIPPSHHKKSQRYLSNHQKKVETLQKNLRASSSLVALSHKSSHNTTRSKEYKKRCHPLDISSFNEILVDPHEKMAFAEPKVTMDELVKETLSYGLIPKIVPEFKGITVGGAIMGGAGESTSFKYGIFNDICKSYQLLNGKGEILNLNEDQHRDLYYGIAGSYGSLGVLTEAKIELMDAPRSIHLKAHIIDHPDEIIERLWSSSASFKDGLALSKDHFLLIEGDPSREKPEKLTDWYYSKASEELYLSPYDYLFRYDQGAFWMGAYLLRPGLLKRFLFEGVLKWKKPKVDHFTLREIELFHHVKLPSPFVQKLLAPWLGSQTLWKIHHKAGKWVGNRMMVQDFCIPKERAATFLKEALDDPGIFPLWLCPIKGTYQPQIFAPHYGASHFVNIGIYGVPAYSAPLREITKKLERKTTEYGGRKVLYSHSYYNLDEFWSIYPKKRYEELRNKLRACGIWKEITEKVL